MRLKTLYSIYSPKEFLHEFGCSHTAAGLQTVPIMNEEMATDEVILLRSDGGALTLHHNGALATGIARLVRCSFQANAMSVFLSCAAASCVSAFRSGMLRCV